MRVRVPLSIILLAALLWLTPATVHAATVGDISKKLICQCGCTKVLANCIQEECMSRDTMTTLIEQKLAQGESQEEIIQAFIARYGEKVLAEPPKRGFNLTAWLLPFVAILGGGGVIYILLKQWVRRGRRYQADAVPKAEEGDEGYQRRVEEELEEFEERGFR